MEDPYKVLSVKPTASKEEITSAYKKLAMKYHPDRNQGNAAQAEAKFKEIQQAYDILKDPQKRAAYDRFGADGVAGMGASSGGGGASGPSPEDLRDIFGDIFDNIGNIFGGGSQRDGRRRGADMQYSIHLTLEEVFHGVVKTIQFQASSLCETCEGSGTKKGSKPVSCSTCGGRGQQRIQQGFLTLQQTCHVCRGSGQIIKDPCSDCRGRGMNQKMKTLSVKIPAGVEHGDRIRLAGEGEASAHGAGDLYVEILIKEHATFSREGQHLYCEVPIDMVSAALGGEVLVPTLGGQVALKIPEETQSGKIFRLKGKGMPGVQGSMAGDLLCRIAVETPVRLNQEQKDLLKKLKQSFEQSGSQHAPRAKSWFENLKKFFENRD